MKRVLAFGAHPDDIEFQCAGTLALLSQRGYEIHMAAMAGGEFGSTTLPPEVIRDVRLRENAESASLIGAHFHYAGGNDGEIEYNSVYRRHALRVLRTVKPSLVLTHPPTDYMIDHEETSRLVRNASFLAPVPNCDPEVLPGSQAVIPHLYYWNTIGQRDIWGRPIPLTCAVDISDVLETKAQMLACHRSQREWLRHHHGMDEYLEEMKRSTVVQGAMIGRPAAEGFAQHLGHGYPQDDLLADVLGDLCVDLHAVAISAQATTRVPVWDVAKSGARV